MSHHRSGSQPRRLRVACLGAAIVAASMAGAPFASAGIQEDLGALIQNFTESGKPSAKSGMVITAKGEEVSILLDSRHFKHEDQTPEQFAADKLDYTIVDAPTKGQLIGTPPALVYRPGPGFTGYDKFTYNVADQEGKQDSGEIQIRVTGSYTAFESGHVRPMAMSADGDRLYAVNTPDNRLEIFDISSGTPEHLESVPVGLEPVAVAVYRDQVWVVNHLSDSISIVDVADAPRVIRTIQVGDEPRDIVFAGPNGNRAFITTAHRGQNSPVNPKLQTPGEGRADVWVFQADNLGSSLIGSPLNIVTLFGDTPRGLAVSPDGRTVYAAIHQSGNQTALVGENPDHLSPTSTKYRKPGPRTDATGLEAPNTALIVKYEGTNWWGSPKWVDENGKNWAYRIRLDLPDYDVFAIDAMASTPKQTDVWSGVGTTLFNMAVNPVNGDIYVSNHEARNEVRFEGEGERADKKTLKGNSVLNRITVISGDRVSPRHLNSHVNYDGHGSESERSMSLAMPLEMAVTKDGRTLFTTAYSSSKIGVFNTRDLASSDPARRAGDTIELSEGGPSGIVLDEDRDRMYVMTRFGNKIITVDLDTRQELSKAAMYNPEPEYLVEGRQFLYDAEYTSAHGTNSCGSCHTFGDMDQLAWDLGNPDGEWFLNPNEYGDSVAVNRVIAKRIQHPLKGPMTTQSLRGMAGAGPMHWRGDRPGEVRLNDESREEASFKQFNPAFVELLGRDEPLTDDEMQKFTNFVMDLRYPPNPIRNLDNSLTADQAAGKEFFMTDISTGLNGADIITCERCHNLDPTIQQFGTDGTMAFEGFQSTQDNKIAHLRNMYTKVGKFGTDTSGIRTEHYGPQIKGFGFRHDGSVDTLSSFFGGDVFSVPDDMKPKLADFMFAFDTGMAPIVGQQITITANSASADFNRLNLLVQRAAVTAPAVRKSIFDPKPECDLIAKGRVDGSMRGWFRTDNGSFLSDDGSSTSLAALKSQAQVPGQEITFTCTPPGSGMRMALDRDEDGSLDANDRLLAGTYPVSIEHQNPNRAPIVIEAETAEEGNFLYENLLRQLNIFPRRPTDF